jgi:hypothetical protein
MPRWLPRALTRIRELAATRKVRFTRKARREMAALAFGLDETDASDVLARLSCKDSAGRLQSASTGEWMYLFKPPLAGTILYLKVVLRNFCVVISLHEEEPGAHEEGD